MSNEFWRDPEMDRMIEDIIEIFTKVEGVELVRLSGLTQRAARVGNKPGISPEIIDNIVHKLKGASVINYQYLTYCPHCFEVSYQITEKDPRKPKLCDTCKTMYNLIDGETIFEREN